MAGFLVRRIVSALVLVFLVTTASFFVTRLVPGSPITQTENMKLSRQQVEDLRSLYGLDQPLLHQYGKWLEQVLLTGDWGDSFGHGRPALTVFKEAVPNTLLLGGCALLVQLAFGISVGVWAALRAGQPVDAVIRVVTLVVFSMPVFWLGLMLILLFHSRLELLPASGMHSLDARFLPAGGRFLDLLHHLLLPALTLGLAYASGLTRYVRNSLLETLGQDFIRTAQAKGLPRSRVLFVHGLRSSLGPLIQLIGLSLPSLLNGVLIIEVVFGWPGIGRLIFTACLARDYPLILVGTTYGAILVVTGTLLADVIHRLVDPRVREEAAV